MQNLGVKMQEILENQNFSLGSISPDFLEALPRKPHLQKAIVCLERLTVAWKTVAKDREPKCILVKKSLF